MLSSHRCPDISLPPRQRLVIAGAEVDAVSFADALALMVQRAKEGSPPSYVVTPNAQHVALLNRDPLLRAIYHEAFLSVPDGVPLLWASRLLGHPLPGRVNGTDLVEALCAAAGECGLRLLFFGGRPGAAEAAARQMNRRYPRSAHIESICPPYGFERDAECSGKITKQIRSLRPDVLLVGLGAPRQEYWIHRNYKTLGIPVCIGVGGSFELLSGRLPRAPRWMQRSGLEWLFRTAVEPRRLLWRYVTTNSVFIALVLRDWLRAPASRVRKPARGSESISE